jgi:hypothetical protein
MNPKLNWKKILGGFTLTEEYHLDRDNTEVAVVLAGSGVPYVRGRFSGPSEKCYPSEGGYVEDVTAFNPETGEPMDLTEDEKELASEYLYGLACEEAQDHYECEGDRAYDEWKDRQMESCES